MEGENPGILFFETKSGKRETHLIGQPNGTGEISKYFQPIRIELKSENEKQINWRIEQMTIVNDLSRSLFIHTLKFHYFFNYINLGEKQRLRDT